MFDDRHDAAILLPKCGPERQAVLPLAHEPAEIPYENHLERGRALTVVINHLSQLWPFSDPSALCLVHEQGGRPIAVLLAALFVVLHLCRPGKSIS